MFAKKLRNRGYTLIEMIASVIILAIILLIAIPSVGGLLDGFRRDYYVKLQQTVMTSGQDYINDNRRLRPSGIFESTVVPTTVLENSKKIDTLLDYRNNKCASTSYVVVIKTADKKYEYESCLFCPLDSYSSSLEERPYCDPAWKTNDNITIELSKPEANIYIPINASLDYIRDKLGIRKQIVKRDADGNVLATLDVDDEDVIYPTNINSFVGSTAISGVVYYEYGSQTMQTNVHIYQHAAPKVTLTNIRNGTTYNQGTWSSGVRVTLEANDEYFGILDVKISEYQYYDVASGQWKKITSCPANSLSCTINYNTTMVNNYRYRIVVAGSLGVVSDTYNFMVDATVPTCNINMITGSGAAYNGAYVNTDKITVRYSAEDQEVAGLPASSMAKAELFIVNQNPIDPFVTQTLTANVAPWRTISDITAEGNYSLMLKCYDTVGNYSTATATVNILRDITVSYYSPNSSTLLQSKVHQYSQPMGTMPTPTRTGYTFLGWYTTPTSGGSKIDSSSVLTTTSKTYSLFARWQANTYTIAYNANGGSGTMSSTACTYDTNCTLRANSFSRTGYSFSGWATTAGGAVAHANSASVTNLTATHGATVTLYAKWTANTYTIAYNANGGSGTMSSTACTYDTNCTLRANSFSRTGYSFSGWATTAGGAVVHTNSKVVSNLSSTHGATVTLYAKWTTNTYTLTINPNGGRIHGSTSNVTMSNLYENYSFFRIPVRTGYSFTSWTQSGSGTITPFGAHLPARTEAVLGGNSYWRDNMFVYNNAGDGTVTVTNTAGTNPFDNSGQFSRITSTGTTMRPGRGGFVFNTVSSAGKVYYHVIVAKVPAGVTLRDARNSIGDGGSSTWLTSTQGTGQMETYIYRVNAGTTGSFSTFGHLYANGGTTSLTWDVYYSHMFDATSATLTNSQGFAFSHTGNKTVTANWKANTYNIAYNANGGSGSMATTSCTYASSCSLRANAFTRTGYGFAGWATSAGGAVAYANSASVTNLSSTQGATVTLYAKWTANTYTIAYNANGGSGSMSNTACTYGSSCSLRANAFTRTGFFFAGWATSSGGAVSYANSASVTNLTATHGATVTLYAKWAGNIYTIAYNANGGSGSMSNTACTYGSSCSLRANAFTRTGYFFAGWATSSGGAVSYANSASVTNLTATHGATVTLYAKWAGNIYTIAYNANGGSGSMSNTACTYGSSCSLRANAFTRTGYFFAGWATSSGGAVSYANSASVTNLTATHGATVTLYAKWAGNIYTIAYNANGGSGTMSSTACTYDTNCTLRANSFTRTNYAFAGWATSAGGAVVHTNGKVVSNLTSTHGATVTLYAKWNQTLIEENATIYTSRESAACDIAGGTKIYFYTTKAENPSSWRTQSATIRYTVNGAVFATLTGELHNTDAYGLWTKFTFGGWNGNTNSSGYHWLRYTRLYAQVTGVVTGGGAITKASAIAGCD